jgi:hypothetical protein
MYKSLQQHKRSHISVELGTQNFQVDLHIMWVCRTEHNYTCLVTPRTNSDFHFAHLI